MTSSAASPGRARIGPRREGFAFPASFAQSRLWFLHQFDPSTSVYNIPAPMRVKARLDVDALRRSFNEIVRRHETLRTTFASVDGEPVQVIAPELTLSLDVVDLRRIPPDAREVEAQRLTMLDAKRPFSLTTGPLLRTGLLRLGLDDYVLLLTMHHIVSDGWSMGILLRELNQIYGAFSMRRRSPLPDLPIQYADFAEWQRDWLKGERLMGHLDYWTTQLRDAPELVDLPTDRPRPPLQAYHGGVHAVELDAARYSALRLLGQRAGTTPFMTLLAVFLTLLCRYSGESDIVVGTPIANRTRTELEGLIGLFVNTLVLRTDISGDPAFTGLLARVREVTLEAYAHQDMPFERLVEELQPSRNLSHNPLFQVMFVFQSAATAGSRQSAGAAQAVNVATGTAKFDLTLSIVEAEAGAVAMFEYNADLFDAPTIERTGSHLVALVDSIVERPDARLSQLAIMGDAERRRVIYEWNDTGAPVPLEEHFIPRAFVAQARRTPDAPALVAGGLSTSYGELLSRSTGLASYLRTLGVGPGTLVGVCMERSADMVAALLAVQQAGGAYVPLDPDYPPDRIALMVQDASPGVLLTETRLVDLLPEHRARVVCLDVGWPEIEPPAEDDCVAELDGADLAYVIYTSGSTGRPKGAMNTHAGIANRLRWMQQTYGLNATDRVLHKTPTSFDVSVWELFWPLITGATMIIADPGRHRDPEYLIRLMGEQRVTTAHFVPSLLRVLLERCVVGSCASLRRVIASGEELSPDVVAAFHALLPGELHNLYGPTEAAVDVTAWACSPGAVAEGVPIGRPIANTQIYLLDRSLDPVPVGVPGELFIGGIGVGRGYLRRPDLTAERFVPDPFSARAGSRLYRTGDRARYRPDGTIDFLGRLDTQTKIRGFRIEVEEIEAVLRGHPVVQDVAVATHEYGPGDKRLVAYVVPDAAQAPTLRTLLRYRREGLLDGRAPADLPNGMTVVVRNLAETEFVYHEIFEERTYLANGIALSSGDVVFDVGANVGLFELFLHAYLDGVKVYAFEPIPDVFELLNLNVGLYGGDVATFMCGLSDAAGEESFTYYPYISILSGRYADAAADAEAVLAYERHKLEDAQSPEGLEEMVSERLVRETVTCELKTVSQVMRENGVTRIDLLKIDAEKSEFDVLVGIDDEDWPKIRQIVAEVHDVEDRHAWMHALLTQHGYSVAVAQAPSLTGTDSHMIYARRIDETRPPAAGDRHPAPHGRNYVGPKQLESELRASVAQRLPDYMVPSEFVLLEELPLTPNGKLDRRALLAPEQCSLGAIATAYVAPRTQLEQQLARLFAGMLKAERVSIRDSFFVLGGHSLLATRLVARLQEAYGVQLSLRRFFEAPTVESVALALGERRDGAAEVVAVESLPRLERAGPTPEVDHFSDEEVAAMLDALLAQEPGDG